MASVQNPGFRLGGRRLTQASDVPSPNAPARLRSFHELMRHRVQRILLVSSLYDSFIMSEEGHLPETLLGHFIDLNRSNIPDLIQVSNSQRALELLGEDDSFDLVVSSIHQEEPNAADFARQVREAGHGVPVFGLAYSNQDLHQFVAHNDTSTLDRIFLWQGDVRIFLAMVMYQEDRKNVEGDTGVHGVPAIILVEDSIRFYSSFLPTIYSELLRHTHNLLSEDLNLSQRMVRMRARPKVLLFDTYDEAWEAFERHGEYVLGVISDFEYPREGKLDKRAGLRLCERVLEARPDIRIVLQSSEPDNRSLADEIGASFLVKGSPVLLQDLRQILVERFGFGDFTFRMPDGPQIDRAHDLKSFAEKLANAPIESIAYHAQRNHFANWLKARTEFALAELLRPRLESEFESPEDLRTQLLEQIEEFRRDRHRTVIAIFDRNRFEPSVSITRIGTGSLGGKARGVAFANRVLKDSHISEQFPEIDVYVPPCAVLATNVFDEFLEFEWLREYATSARTDAEIAQLFQQAPFPRSAGSDLRTLLQRVKHPLAVRSSSLMEDSLSQPFAGVYETHMIPNNDTQLDVRLRQLTSAVRAVYASTFTEKAKAYLSMTSYRLEEEKMAVIIQELVGRTHQDRFYPDFAGVARSHNFYPEPGHAAEDGVAAVALGMGRTVVGGGRCLRFCPLYPRHIVGFSSVDDALQNSQREFQALDLTRDHGGHGLIGFQRHPLEVAEADGTLAWLASTFTASDNRIVDGTSRPGIRLVSFAQVLKHDAFPLAELLRVLLARCSEGTGAPVEIEFAGNFGGDGRRPQFAFLQLRPMAMSKEGATIDLGDEPDDSVICRSDTVLGNGEIENVRDLVVIDIKRFDRLKTREIAQEIARFDGLLRNEGAPYILIGVGRWGSADPSLGVPVGWNQIAGARAIVEAGFEDITVAPSQGTHFFQNLTSSNVGYFTVNPELGQGQLDWAWLTGLEALNETRYVRHIRLPGAAVIRIDGRDGHGVILKPTNQST